MRSIRIDSYEINTPITEILAVLRLALTNGKLKDIRNNGDNIIVTCPHHANGHEATPACNIYIGNNFDLEYGFFHCFVCGEKGNFVKFVQECFDSSEDFAKKWLINNFGSKVKSSIQLAPPITISKTKKRTFTNFYDKKILDQFQSWCPYLASRKLSRETCEKFNVKYDPKWHNVIFPCYDNQGRLVMLPSRSIYSKKFYLDKDFERPVYCLDYINKNNIKKAIITEGPIDCLTCYEYGFPAVATLGQLDEFQVNQINKSSIQVLYLMFDNDEAGQKFARTLKKYITPRIILVEPKFPPNRKDINDLSLEEFQNMLKIN